MNFKNNIKGKEVLKMKKNTQTIHLLYLLYTVFIIRKADAAEIKTWGYTPAPGGVPTDIELAIMNLINYILGFVVIIATLVVIYGGILYLTSIGNDTQIDQAKKTIAAGIVGLVITGLAYAIVIVVSTVILQS